MHSALLVGLLRAKMIGRSWKEAMSLRICSVKAPAMAATPIGKRWVVEKPTLYKQPISLLVVGWGSEVQHERLRSLGDGICHRDGGSREKRVLLA